jgi:hypothetical protein
LGKIKLRSDSRCADAVTELSGVTSTPRRAKPKGWGGYLGLLYKDVYLVATYSQTKPPVEKLVAWSTKTHDVWLPNEREEDLVALCRSIAETSLADFVIWHDFVNMDYGLVEMKAPPRVVDLQTCQDFNLDTTLCHQPNTERSCLWWQEWVGRLYKAELHEDIDHDSLQFKHTALAECVGAYKRLPFYLRR